MAGRGGRIVRTQQPLAGASAPPRGQVPWAAAGLPAASPLGGGIGLANLVRFSECAFSVFISCARADDTPNNSGVSNFAKVRSADLEAALARANKGRNDTPGVQLSKYTGPIAGDLGPQLRVPLEKSFALVIVVDENCASSDWCLPELRCVDEAFGNAGLDARLYMLALRTAPVDAVSARPHWQQVFANRHQAWQPLFDLAKIRADLTVPPAPKAQPRWVVGACTSELAPRVQRFTDKLGRHEPLVGLVEPATLLRSQDLQAMLQGASVLVLPFNRGQPINGAVDGGHIAQQVAAWRKLNKRDDAIVLLDLCDIPTTETAEPQHLTYLDDCLLARLQLGAQIRSR